MSNSQYQNSRLDRFYASRRQTWAGVYPSEQWIFERLAARSEPPTDVLDVGCASGGIGRALIERFGLTSYTGIDINPGVIEAANANPFPIVPEFHCLDIVKWTPPRQYRTVLSLSCADFNVETQAILNAAWRAVAPGGVLVVSLRLSPSTGVNDISQSYQLLETDATHDRDQVRANYVVMNTLEALSLFRNLRPAVDHVLAYGYWGLPAETARTPFERLVFTVFAVRKSQPDSVEPAISELHLPLDAWPR